LAEPTDDGEVLAEIAVAAQGGEIDDQLSDIVAGVRPLRMPRHLRFLPGVEARIGFLEGLLRLLSKPCDFLLDRDRTVSLSKRA
jgi:hypothetical protein